MLTPQHAPPSDQPMQRLSRREVLFSLWVFVMFLYAYGDILGLFDSTVLNQLLTGVIDGIVMNEMFLLAAAVLMILPISMVLFTRILPHKFARAGCIIVGAIKTIVVLLTLLTPCTLYYWLFSLIEIPTTIAIVYLAWTWRVEDQ